LSKGKPLNVEDKTAPSPDLTPTLSKWRGSKRRCEVTFVLQIDSCMNKFQLIILKFVLNVL